MPSTKDWAFDFGRDVTRKEAIRAATVFAESGAAFYGGAAEYVSPAYTGTYDTSINTPELLNKKTIFLCQHTSHFPEPGVEWVSAAERTRSTLTKILKNQT